MNQNGATTIKFTIAVNYEIRLSKAKPRMKARILSLKLSNIGPRKNLNCATHKLPQLLELLSFVFEPCLAKWQCLLVNFTTPVEAGAVRGIIIASSILKARSYNVEPIPEITSPNFLVELAPCWVTSNLSTILLEEDQLR